MGISARGGVSIWKLSIGRRITRCLARLTKKDTEEPSLEMVKERETEIKREGRKERERRRDRRDRREEMYMNM